MRIIIFYVLLVSGSLAKCISCEDEKTYAQVCLEESNAKRVYDANFGKSGYDEDVSFNRLLEKRKERVELGEKLKIVDCSEEAKKDERVVVIKDEELLNHLCLESVALDAKFKANEADQMLHAKIQKMARESRWRIQKLATAMGLIEEKKKYACPPVDEKNLPSYDGLEENLKQYFHYSCKMEAETNYIRRKVFQIVSDIKSNELELFGLEAANKFDDYNYSRLEFCSLTLEECCGKQLIEKSVAEAIVKIAEESLNVAESKVAPARDQFEEEKKASDWVDQFKRLCALEHHTNPKNHFYPAREHTLAGLHDRTVKARSAMGAILNEPTCPSDTLDNMEQMGNIPPVARMDVDPKCEEKVKSRFLCRAYSDAQSSMLSYLGRDIVQLRDHWCLRDNKIQAARTSVLKIYKPPTCSDELVAMLNDDAAVEATVTLELMELEHATEVANGARKDVINGLRDQYNFLSKIAKVCQKELDDSTTEIGKEQSRKALQLVNDTLDKLESSELKKSNKFDLFKMFDISG